MRRMTENSVQKLISVRKISMAMVVQAPDFGFGKNICFS